MIASSGLASPVASSVPHNPTKADVTSRNILCVFSILSRKSQQDVNKRRLGVLLGEVQRGEGGEERWKAALDGRTSGTTSGSSKGVRM